MNLKQVGNAAGSMIKSLGVGGAHVAKDSFRSAKQLGKAISSAPPLVRMGMVGTGIVGAGLAARAFTSDDSYQTEDHTVPDGMGGYEVETGVRQRMQAMGGGGDLVFGLHARRH